MAFSLPSLKRLSGISQERHSALAKGTESFRRRPPCWRVEGLIHFSIQYQQEASPLLSPILFVHCLSPSASEKIPDPYGRALPDFVACLQPACPRTCHMLLLTPHPSNSTSRGKHDGQDWAPNQRQRRGKTGQGREAVGRSEKPCVGASSSLWKGAMREPPWETASPALGLTSLWRNPNPTLAWQVASSASECWGFPPGKTTDNGTRVTPTAPLN